MSKKTSAQLEREIDQLLRGHKRRIAHVGFGSAPSSKVTNPTWTKYLETQQYKPGRAERRDPTLPKGETFAVKDRNGNILGTSTSVEGAMSKAPAGSSYALVRGEYTSDGSRHGIGHGRQVAVREGGRWQRG